METTEHLAIFDLPTLDPITVFVQGPPHRLMGLSAYLPPGWRVSRAAPTPHAEIILLVDPHPAEVTSTCLRHPDAAVIAVLDAFSTDAQSVGVLEAGADACVRTDHAAIVAAHIEACRRRQVASPWRAAA
jgi:hypothetical protein